MFTVPLKKYSAVFPDRLTLTKILFKYASIAVLLRIVFVTANRQQQNAMFIELHGDAQYNGDVATTQYARVSMSDTLILLQSESPSGKGAKLHTVAASNNRDHTL